jgi:(2Fe-2S) ferredoxin
MSDRKKPGDPAPYYEAHVFCCVNERPEGHPRGCCKKKGSEKLRNYLKARAKELGLDGVRINQALCLDRCELGPTMVIYPEQAEEILQKHLIKGERVERLLLQPTDKVPEDLER